MLYGYARLPYVDYVEPILSARAPVSVSYTHLDVYKRQVHDCVFTGTKSGLRFKTRRSRGGGGENLTFERIRMNLTGAAFWWDMLGEEKHVGDLAKRLPARPITPLTPSFKNITIRDIIVESASYFIDLNGIPAVSYTHLTHSSIRSMRPIM